MWWRGHDQERDRTRHGASKSAVVNAWRRTVGRKICPLRVHSPCQKAFKLHLPAHTEGSPHFCLSHEIWAFLFFSRCASWAWPWRARILNPLPLSRLCKLLFSLLSLSMNLMIVVFVFSCFCVLIILFHLTRLPSLK